MTGILKVDQWKDSGDNALITSDGSGALTFNASSITGVATTNGITSAEQWRLSTSFTGNADPITNLERADNTKSGSVGTSITESSGVFTLPTGIWKIEFSPQIYGSGGTDAQVNGQIKVDETGGGTFTEYANTLINLVNNSWTTGYVSIMLDVTDSNVKVRFAIAGNAGEVGGNSSQTFTHMNFIRLGDT
tara:strand:+ start:454 stop:1023 length:570 start_codon:yes stop_codon:yes gene_type:complete